VSVAERVARVRERIAAAAVEVGRDPNGVTLVAVSKTHPPERCREALAAGVTDLAENRVAEWVAKHPLVEGARWHFVGRLQSRKATDLVGEDVLVHSVDRRSLVDRLERLAADRGVVQRVLVQVNVGDDPRKAGCSLPGTEDLVSYIAAQSHVAVEGLMTIPPLPPTGVDPNAAARPLFESLRAEADRLGLPTTSMGMSADLEAAVAAGATHVRIGTAVFGPRGDGPWQPVIDRSSS
jgi:pyridoxal phosphate enzyme (YggS family)